MRLSHNDFLAVVKNAPLVSMDILAADASGRVLVGLRKNEPARGDWFVPGGCVQKGETLAKAFARISAGELGREMAFSVARFLGVYEHFYPVNFAGEPGFDTHYVVLAYQVDGEGLSPPADDDQHEAWRWLLPDEILADPGVHENTRRYFQEDQTHAGPV
ncbi:MAG: GDP-mannose mannosyl hydrolase [Proteobacteria bacterium]|nr:GDP-mannose mannosyl hydrolase [Pseudomonadota bacterium]